MISPIFEHTQQLDLRGHRHITDFVENNVPPWAYAILPTRSKRASVNRPFDMAKKFALENRFAERGAI